MAVPADSRNVRVVLQPAPFFEAVNVTSSRTDVPKADPTATMTVFSSSELLTSARADARRCAQGRPRLHAVPPHLVARVESDRPGHHAARSRRHRREPVAGAGRRRAAERRVRRLGVLGQAAAGGDRSGRGAARQRQRSLRRRRRRRRRADPDVAPGAADRTRAGRRRRPRDRPRLALRRRPRRGGWSYTARRRVVLRPTGTLRWPREQDPGIASRGPIDTKVGSTHRSGMASLGYQAGNGWRVELSGNVFTERSRERHSRGDQRHGVAAGDRRDGRRSDRGRAAVRARLRRHAGLRPDVFGGLRRSHDRGSQPPAARADRVAGVGDAMDAQVRARTRMLVGAEGKFIKGETQETQLVSRPGDGHAR